MNFFQTLLTDSWEFTEMYLRIERPCVMNWRCLMQNKKTSIKEKGEGRNG